MKLLLRFYQLLNKAWAKLSSGTSQKFIDQQI